MMIVKIQVLVCVLLGVSAVFSQNMDTEIATKYKCGKDCDEKLMGSEDPNADAMPHQFGPHVPLTNPALTNTMNAYLKNDPAHQEDELMVPHPHAVMPDVEIVADKAPNCDEPETKAVPTLPITTPKSAIIPYLNENEKPAMRRPCNMDQVIELLKKVKENVQSEDHHDSELQLAIADGLSPLKSAEIHQQEAQDQVKKLETAKHANETLTNIMESIRIKADLMEKTMSEKALLIKEEGMLKAPILKAIGRTNINLQSAVAAKQAALNDFAQHPSFTKDEMSQIIATYDELIISIKNQLAKLHKESSDVLTPIQLKIDKISHTLTQNQAEIEQLKQEQAQLLPIAEIYTPAALEAAHTVLNDALAHYNAEKAAQQIDLSSFDQRSADRSSIAHLIDEMLTLIADIQQPQDPADAYVEVREPISLAGSVPKHT